MAYTNTLHIQTHTPNYYAIFGLFPTDLPDFTFKKWWTFEKKMPVVLTSNIAFDEATAGKFRDEFNSQLTKMPKYATTLHIKNFNQNRLPAFVPTEILNILKANPYITSVNGARELFNNIELQQLHKILEGNARQLNSDWRQKWWMKTASISLLLSKTIWSRWITSKPYTLLIMLTGSYLLMGMAWLRQRYLDYATAQYPVEKIKEIVNQDELAALRMGAQAVSWKGYLFSFGNLASTKHCVAFAAGLQLAIDNNEAALKMLEPKNEPLPQSQPGQFPSLYTSALSGFK